MIIRFAKHANKHPSMSCIRDDGSRTWMSSPNQGAFFVIHDLLHYAVETTLGYESAFFGLVAAGREIDDFGSGSPPLPEEAHLAELLVGHLQTSMLGGYEGFVAHVEMDNENRELSAPVLSRETYSAITTLWKDLLRQWGDLPDDGAFELPFPVGQN